MCLKRQKKIKMLERSLLLIAGGIKSFGNQNAVETLNIKRKALK